MATLWIREYSALPSVPGSYRQIASEPGTDQTVTYTTTTQSNAFAASTSYIGITSDSNFHYVVGANPSATTSNFKIPANTPFFVAVAAGQKIAAVTGT